MVNLILISLAVAFFVSAFEELVRPLGKWRGLFSLAVAFGGCFLAGGMSIGVAIVTAVAAAFVGIVVTFVVQSVFAPKELRVLPRRIPPL